MAQLISQTAQEAIDDLQMEIQFQKVILKSIEDAPAENQVEARADIIVEIRRLERELKRLKGDTGTTSSSQALSASQYTDCSPDLQLPKSLTAPRANRGMI